ncbi:MAG: hypothetical protein WDM89_19855 [Rhizomicrobium sp.]
MRTSKSRNSRFAPLIPKEPASFIPKVALLLETLHRIWPRASARHHALRADQRALVDLHQPGHLGQALPRAKTWQGHGVITRIHSNAMARAIRATGLPIVASPLEELASRETENGFCEIRTDSPGIARMAANHLVERGLRNFAFCGFRAVQWSIVREETFKPASCRPSAFIAIRAAFQC